MLVLGLGVGTAMNPVLLAAMSDVEPEQAGLASGVVNTAFMMGGALGLAVLASLAASRSESLAAGGDAPIAALTGGYHASFVIGAVFAGAGGRGRGVLAGRRRPGANLGDVDREHRAVRRLAPVLRVLLCEERERTVALLAAV
jgi:MFS family permease